MGIKNTWNQDIDHLISNFSIMLIWFITFQYCINLVLTVIFWMKIDDVFDEQKKKLVSVDVTIN